MSSDVETIDTIKTEEVLKNDQKKELKKQKRIQYKQTQKTKRYDFLASMSGEERKVFLVKEKEEKTKHEQALKNACSDGQQIVVDCQFDGIMNQKEINSLAKQILHSYAYIKRMPQDPFGLHVTSFKSRIAIALNNIDVNRWPCVETHEQDVESAFQPSQLVYLTPDSDNVLTKLDRNKVYIIGGIVDRSRKKGQTVQKAETIDVCTARLPIQEYIPDKLDHILNVNTVIEVLGNFQKSRDWEIALSTALPSRKQCSFGRRAKRRREKQKRKNCTELQEIE